MPATAGYQAGAETNNFQLSYAAEATWGTLPAVQFRALRINSESLRGQKQRQRPSEINANGEAAAASTTQESASGGYSSPLAYGVNDDIIASLIRNDFGAALSISDTTVAMSAAGVLSATTSNLFANIVVGDWVRLGGFAASGGANNGLALVIAKASNLNITVARRAPFVLEAAGAARTIRHNGTVANGTQFQSLFLQKRVNTGQFLRYPGAFLGGASLSAGLGNFLSMDFQILAREETRALTDASTGAIIAAATGRAHDPVGGFGPMLIAFGTTVIAPRGVEATVQMTNEGAAPQYELGSAAAAGMTMGTFTGGMTMAAYFDSFDIYDRFKSETAGVFGFATSDAAGNAYGITAPAAVPMNPNITAGGPGQAVRATYEIETNPSPTGTIRITRLNAP